MNYGVYGGAFDPFHDGHMSVIRGAIKSEKIDRLIVVPTGMPVFKNSRDLTPAPYRYYMVKNALKDIPECTVSPLEILDENPSYTVNTMSELIREEKAGSADRWFLIVGADVVFEFESWYMPDQIMSLATLLVASRPGFQEGERLRKTKEIADRFNGDVDFFEIDPVDVSSSVIRENNDFSMVPEEVRSFVSANGLYPLDRPLHRVSDSAFDRFIGCLRILFSELSEKRLLHSLNTAVLSARYAIRFNENPDQALIAGLLHDCAKELSLEEQRKMAGDVDKDDSSIIEMIHAPAGAGYAKTRYGVSEEEILRAIAYHTTGRAHMSGIEKIVYLADKLEPSRKFDDLSEIRRLVQTDLDAAMFECLTAVRDSLERKGMIFHKDSHEALQVLISEKEQREKLEERMDSKKISETISEILNEKKASNLDVVYVRNKTVIADYFVVATGTSTTHVKALADEVAFVMKDQYRIIPERIEGISTSRWILIDYRDVVVHIFHPEERENYSLEKLWATRPEDPMIADGLSDIKN